MSGAIPREKATSCFHHGWNLYEKTMTITFAESKALKTAKGLLHHMGADYSSIPTIIKKELKQTESYLGCATTILSWVSLPHKIHKFTVDCHRISQMNKKVAKEKNVNNIIKLVGLYFKVTYLLIALILTILIKPIHFAAKVATINQEVKKVTRCAKTLQLVASSLKCICYLCDIINNKRRLQRSFELILTIALLVVSILMLLHVSNSYIPLIILTSISSVTGLIKSYYKIERLTK